MAEIMRHALLLFNPARAVILGHEAHLALGRVVPFGSRCPPIKRGVSWWGAAGTEEETLERRSFQPGERLFVEGEAGHEAYIIETGKVEIAKKVAGGEHCILDYSGKGEMIGEMALIDDAPRMASARATEPTAVLVVPRSEFERRLSGSDAVVRRVLQLLARRLRTQAGRVAERHTVVR